MCYCCQCGLVLPGYARLQKVLSWRSLLFLSACAADNHMHVLESLSSRILWDAVLPQLQDAFQVLMLLWESAWSLEDVMRVCDHVPWLIFPLCFFLPTRAIAFLSECDLLKIEDILPFFPDFVTIDDFKVQQPPELNTDAWCFCFFHFASQCLSLTILAFLTDPIRASGFILSGFLTCTNCLRFLDACDSLLLTVF